MEHDNGMVSDHIGKLADHESRIGALEGWQDRMENGVLKDLSVGIKDLAIAVGKLEAIGEYKRWILPMVSSVVVGLLAVWVTLWVSCR